MRSQLAVVGINIYPTAQRKNPMGRRVRADLRVYRETQHPQIHTFSSRRVLAMDTHQ